MEFLPNIPDYVYRYASFLFSFLGRGICKLVQKEFVSPAPELIPLVYIFVGSILLHDGVLRYIAGSIIGFIGLAYVVLEFIPSIEPPANMREADQTWGAEQV